jgi:peroxiredoxin
LSRRLSSALALGVVALLLLFGWQRRDRFAPAVVGEPAPDFAAPTLAGDTLALEALRGRAVVLNVWATWCAPCREEMPALDRLYRQHRDDGLVVLAVSVDAGSDAARLVRAFVADLDLAFPVLLDPAGTLQDRFGVNGLPTTFLIDRGGRIRARVLGPAEWDRPPRLDDVRRLLES